MEITFSKAFNLLKRCYISKMSSISRILREFVHDLVLNHKGLKCCTSDWPIFSSSSVSVVGGSGGGLAGPEYGAAGRTGERGG